MMNPSIQPQYMSPNSLPKPRGRTSTKVPNSGPPKRGPASDSLICGIRPPVRVMDPNASPGSTKNKSNMQFSSQTPVVPTMSPFSDSDSLAHLPNHLYVPHVHRQQTEIPMPGPLTLALSTLSAKCPNYGTGSEDRISASREACNLIDMVYLALTRNQLGLKFSNYFLAEGICHWQSVPETRVICFIPFQIDGIKFNQIDAGTCSLSFRTSSPTKLDITIKETNTYPSNHVSLKRMYSTILKMLRKSFLAKGLSADRLMFSATKRQIEVALFEPEGWLVEIIPCLLVKGSKHLLCGKPWDLLSVALPFINSSTLQDQDEDTKCYSSSPVHPNTHGTISTRNSIISPSSSGSNSIPLSESECTLEDEDFFEEVAHDTKWFACDPQKENLLIERIQRTDGGLRDSAVRIVYELCAADWRLTDVTIYDVQTAMLHCMDRQLDSTPRWQRDQLESNTLEILTTLGQFANEHHLPHFLIPGLNLWQRLSTKRLALMSKAFERLSTSNVSLLSLVCRAGKFSLPPDMQPYSELLTPRQTN